MAIKFSNKSLVILLVVLIAGFIHTIPLWNWQENLAGGYGDPLSHATIGQWYCGHVLNANFPSDQFLAPFGADMSGTYDSPFPFALTCPFTAVGTIFQFHLFTLLQIWLILIGAWLVAVFFIESPSRQLAYILLVWWCGFYVARAHQHMTLLSMIWGVQFVLYAVMSLDLKSRRSVLGAGLLLGLSYTGTFQNIPTLFFLTLALVTFKFWQERKILFDRTTLKNLFLGAMVALGVFLIFWWPMIAYTLKNGTVAVDADRKLYNLDLLSAFIPFEGNLVFSWWSSIPTLPLEKINAFDPLVVFIVLVSMCKKQFWKDSFRVLLLATAAVYFVLALGPELRFNGETIAYLDFNSELFRIFPLRVTRTPGRLALVSNLCLILMAFIFIGQLGSDRLKKNISYFLVVWAILMGPFLNQMWFFPTLKYASIFNANAMNEIRGLSKDLIVVQVPTAWAQDPAQNFQQIFHGKRISSGYLAYTNYNKSVQEKFAQEPLLGKLGCDGDFTAFEPTPLMSNSEQLHQYMKSNRYEVVIINKMLMLNNPACARLTSWVQNFIKQPWVKGLEENSLFLVLRIL